MSAVLIAPGIFAAFALGAGWVNLSARAYLLRAATFLALLVAVACVWNASLGLPRPSQLSISAPSGKLLKYVFDERAGVIYLWLQDDSGMPRSYTVPFTKDQAQQIQDAAANGGRGSGTVRFGERGGRMMAWRAPVSGDPLKPAEVSP